MKKEGLVPSHDCKKAYIFTILVLTRRIFVSGHVGYPTVRHDRAADECRAARRLGHGRVRHCGHAVAALHCVRPETGKRCAPVCLHPNTGSRRLAKSTILGSVLL